jgi:hypothetical protein
MWTADGGGSLRLEQEAFGDVLVVRKVTTKHLDRHFFADDAVTRQIDDAHAALAEHRLDLVTIVDLDRESAPGGGHGRGVRHQGTGEGLGAMKRQEQRLSARLDGT